jgi:uncharacterized damage-inducible protein DinB
MQNKTIEQYKTWFEYEKDAHLKTIDSLYTVPAKKRKFKEFQKAVDLFAHIVGARIMWLHRFGFLKEKPVDLFPAKVDVNSLSSIADKMYSVWDDYFNKLDEKELQRVFEYKSTEGLWYTNKIEELLTQLFGHSWYHRGQIAMLVRMIGGIPAETDYVYSKRIPIPAKD